jgi:hypothetical protein
MPQEGSAIKRELIKKHRRVILYLSLCVSLCLASCAGYPWCAPNQSCHHPPAPWRLRMMDRDAQEWRHRFFCVLKGDDYYCPLGGTTNQFYRIPRKEYEELVER